MSNAFCTQSETNKEVWRKLQGVFWRKSERRAILIEAHQHVPRESNGHLSPGTELQALLALHVETRLLEKLKQRSGHGANTTAVMKTLKLSAFSS